MNNNEIREALVKKKYLSPEAIAQAEEYAKTHGIPLEESLIFLELISRDLLGQATAEYLDVPYSDLNSVEPSRDDILKVPEDIAKKFRVVFFNENKKEGAITFATENPREKLLEDSLKNCFPGKTVKLTYSLPEDISKVLSIYQKPLEVRFSKIIGIGKRIAPEMLDEVFEDARVANASDIHFEPETKDIAIRFRIDGVLHEVGRISKDNYENILNRVKVQGRMRIDEHLTAQDGAFREEKGDQVFDFRASIMPTVEGEKTVLRALTAYVHGLSLGDLGFSEGNEDILKRAVQKPFGMMLITGQTGSGKTTTLYALLKLLNSRELNITTIEDPVEYRIPGVNQIQVNPAANLTFANGLRSIVRQDPDVILVGEIRDPETAEIAVNAALTGHLVLSTFHANDAATAIPRLINMKIEPFLLASTLELIGSQRLVRRICESCRYSLPEKGNGDDFKRYFKDQKIIFYAGKGCPACGHTGYKGRAALFEFIPVTQRLKDLVMERPSAQSIKTLARETGSRSLFEDGILKVKNGITTIDELLRVAEPPDENIK